MRRLLRHFTTLACAALLAGCASDTGPSDAPGALHAEITLAGASADQVRAGELRLYGSASDFEDEVAPRRTPLEGGPAAWRATVAELAPGTYYLRACFDFGCGDYRTETGAPRPIAVTAGRTTEVTAAF
ncbi:MAG TPA: hypothetical protein VFS40_09605 [Gemmatimonadales bacterium]|nr:hypothetical protein [Gemmatimonadales bacterium]